eukprot:gene19777-39266_t
MAICFDSGLRVSNLTKAEKGNEDHCIRAVQLSFTVEDHLEGNRLHAGYRPVVFQEGRLWVESVAMAYSSNKTSGVSGACVLDPKKIGRRSFIESNLLDDLVHSGVLGNDPLFTRRCPQSRIRFLRRRDVDGGIKEVCRAFGQDGSLPSPFGEALVLRAQRPA